jgi:protein gp37
MGEGSKIQWTHHTFNPWVGCQRVSPGCEHCYAEAYDKRVGGAPKKSRPDPSKPLLRWGPKAPRTRTSPSYWRGPSKWNAAALAAGERHRVFCASLADVFEDRAELVPWREQLFGLIASTLHLDWLLLTKRPENITRLWPETISEPNGGGGVLECPRPGPANWPNLWLGATLEDKRYQRVVDLREVPAAVHFLSCEPLLEGVSPNLEGIDWVIIGGESGGNARKFDVAWARSLIKKCRAANAAPFVKQMGAFVVDHNDAGFEAERDTVVATGLPVEEGAWPTPLDVEHDIDGYRDEYQGAPVRVRLRDSHGGDMAEWPHDLRVRELPRVRR